MFTPQAIKNDFPLFKNHSNLVYLDSAATTLKPQVVIDAEREYSEQYSSNVGRGLYPLAEMATERFETVRAKTARFIGAEEREIIFTSGTTDAINTAARLLENSLFSSHPEQSRSLPAGRQGSRSNTTRFLDKLGMTKKNIVTTALEHHSNFLPWKELAKRTGAEFRIAKITDDGAIDIQALIDLIDEHTAIVAFSAVSNVTGAVSDVAGIIKSIRAKHPETTILVDAAQAVAHMPISVVAWDADFIAFSAHKAFGPTGVGILYGRATLLEKLAPVTFGGGMVFNASSDTPEYKDIPNRFEAGTPNIGGVIAWGAALDYIGTIGLDRIHTHETALATYALQALHEAFGDTIRIIGPTDPKNRSGITSFSMEGVHPHDIAHLLGESDICVRAGEHCAAPLHRALGLSATTRLSLSIYNSEEDIDKLIKRLKEIKNIFSK